MVTATPAAYKCLGMHGLLGECGVVTARQAVCEIMIGTCHTS